MVGVGDTVFVTPVNGQKDYIAVITGPGGATGGTGAAGGIAEGNYNMWTYKWTFTIPDNVYSDYAAWFIDEINGVFYLNWAKSSSVNAFGIYNLSNHSTVFESLTDYTASAPFGVKGVCIGHANVNYGFSRTLQTYTLIMRADWHTIEVWRGEASPLWSYDPVTDDPGQGYADQFSISGTGKYIMLYIHGGGEHLMLYQGFDSGTSTTVTETVITDAAKSWVTNELIGHIVYITSGGADGQEGTITSNTATAITCSAATFVTWGMSVGDTYKID